MPFIRDWQEFLAQFLVHIYTFNSRIRINYAKIKVIIRHFSNSILCYSGYYSNRYYLTDKFPGREQITH